MIECGVKVNVPGIVEGTDATGKVRVRLLSGQVVLIEEGYIDGSAAPRRSLRRLEKNCPETGGICQHRETCDGPTVTCWARHARLASEPEGRTTGLHRDSMG